MFSKHVDSGYFGNVKKSQLYSFNLFFMISTRAILNK